MEYKLSFQDFVIFCFQTACGLDDVFVLPKSYYQEPTLEAIEEYFREIRKNKEFELLKKSFKVFLEEYQIKEFYEKVYLDDR